MVNVSKRKTTESEFEFPELAENTNLESLSESEQASLNERFDKFSQMLKTRNIWGYDINGLRAVQAARSMADLKNGLYARIPIYCRDAECPYEESCALRKAGIAPKGQACAVEVANMQRKYLAYAREFDLDSEDSTWTDENIVAEIIKMEIMMERCDALMSKEQSPVTMTVVGVSQDGQAIEAPDISKALQAYEKCSKRRGDLYSSMLATRKDRKKDEQPEEKNILDMIQEIEEQDGFYEIEKRPDYIPGVDDRAEKRKDDG